VVKDLFTEICMLAVFVLSQKRLNQLKVKGTGLNFNQIVFE